MNVKNLKISVTWCVPIAFIPQLPYRSVFSKHSCSLLHQMFCKVLNKNHKNMSSFIAGNSISDHIPCIIKIDLLCDSNTPPKYIPIRTANDAAINNFRIYLTKTDITLIISSNMTTDPNSGYTKFERIITTAYEKHFPKQRLKFNKHNQKLSDWITSNFTIDYTDV